MKKLNLLILCMIVVVLSGCSKVAPDKYDKENYIGAADVEKDLAKELQVTREDMSTFTIDGDKAYMSGYISADTIRQVKKLIKDYTSVKTIIMENVGGSVDDVSNLKASRLVKDAGLNTYVPKDGFIASGGTDFFCAGVTRIAEEGAQVGVHSWADGDIENAALLPKDNKAHKKYITYYQEMNMPDPEGFYFFTINAAVSNSMYYMTMDELVKYGLVSEVK